MKDIADPTIRHSIPVVDRLMEVLGQLERHPGGRTITELTQTLRLPRTTIYRILNSLQRYQMVRRDPSGSYHLGSRLLTLASHVASHGSEFDLATVAQAHMARLSGETGETIKLSVRDGDEVLVLAVAQGQREYALTVPAGQRVPAHVGAASKLLLAFSSAAARQRVLDKPLVAFTPRTVTDPRRLESELARIKRQGWAQDKGENVPSIHAFAAPVHGPDGAVVAALSIPFLAGTAASRMEALRVAVIAAAKAIEGSLA